MQRRIDWLSTATETWPKNSMEPEHQDGAEDGLFPSCEQLSHPGRVYAIHVSIGQIVRS